MKASTKYFRAVIAWAFVMASSYAWANPFVPGHGQRLDQVGDDFEDSSWSYDANLPKSSRNIDKRERLPWGASLNGRWIEGPHRGTPDFVQRVKTPADGIPGSQGSLLIQTKASGVPGRISNEPQQDDLMIGIRHRLSGPISTSLSPSTVVRVYVPQFQQWEPRNGTSFAFRIDLRGRKARSRKLEQYWPGMFLQFRSAKRGHAKDSAHLVLRAQSSGHDFRGPEVTPGWWTLGMSVTPDGQVHFFARQGVGELTADDHLASRFCYGYRASQFEMVFFNVLSQDNGRTFSTPWVIDDPTIHIARGNGRLARRAAK